MKSWLKNPRFQWPYGVLALLLGLGIAAALRLTWHHEVLVYGKQAASIGLCPENQAISCDLVNTSSYSELWGIPIALLAVPTYLFLLGLILFRFRWLQARSLIVGLGLATSFYSLFLAGVSFWELGFACLWCGFLYFVNLATLVLGILGKRREQPEKVQFPSAQLLRGAISYVFVTVTIVLAQKGYRSLLIQRGQDSRVASVNQLSAMTPKHNSVGKCLPPVTLTDIRSGTDVSIFEKTPNQKSTFLVFWSATCGHCRKEMPQLAEFINKNRDLFHFVTASSLRSKRKVGELSFRDFTLKFANEIDLKVPILNDPGILSGLLQVAGTPTSFIIAPNGRVMKEWKGVIPELGKSLKIASRDLASISPQPCSENLVAAPTQMSDWLLRDREKKELRLKSLISAPTLIWVRSQVKEFTGTDWDDFLKVTREVKKQGWKVLLVANGSPQKSPPFSFPLYFTTEPTSSPGVYLVASNGALIKNLLGPLEWNNPTFQEQVFAWLKNS